MQRVERFVARRGSAVREDGGRRAATRGSAGGGPPRGASRFVFAAAATRRETRLERTGGHGEERAGGHHGAAGLGAAVRLRGVVGVHEPVTLERLGDARVGFDRRVEGKHGRVGELGARHRCRAVGHGRKRRVGARVRRVFRRATMPATPRLVETRVVEPVERAVSPRVHPRALQRIEHGPHRILRAPEHEPVPRSDELRAYARRRGRTERGLRRPT